MIKTSIYEFNRQEVEKLLEVTTVFSTYDMENGVQDVCVDHYKKNRTNSEINNEDAVELLFNLLKEKGLVPQEVEDFSYEMCSCGKIPNLRTSHKQNEQDYNVIISFALKCNV